MRVMKKLNALFLFSLSCGLSIAASPGTGDSAPELRFSEMYQMPVGPEGLVASDRLQSLAGRHVRIEGFLVREAPTSTDTLILSPVPVSAPDEEDGPADDYPPQIVFVHLRKAEHRSHPFRTLQRVTFEGVLELGPRQEGDGRISQIRLRQAVPARVTRQIPNPIP